MQQRQDKIIYILEGQRGITFQRDFLASPHSLLVLQPGLALPCLAPAPLLQTWKWSQSPAYRTLELYCALLRQQDKWKRIASLNLSLPCSLLALQYLCVLKCPWPTHAMGSYCFPRFTGDQESNLLYQYGAEVIPFSTACLVSLSETAVSTVGLTSPVCRSTAEPVAFSALHICTQQYKFEC